MAEWHLTPEYILDNWTDEELNLMIEKLAERKNREYSPPASDGGVEQSVSLETLADMSHGNIKVVKKEN